MAEIKKNNKTSQTIRTFIIIILSLIFIFVLLVMVFVQGFLLRDRNETPIFDPMFRYKFHLVTDVIDGDTFVIDNNRAILLSGVDAPEGDECWAQESKDELTSLLKGQKIQLYSDDPNKHSFEVLRWYVFLPDEYEELDPLLVNEYLIRLGYAKVAQDYQNKVYLDGFLSLQQSAAEDQKGMWGACLAE